MPTTMIMFLMCQNQNGPNLNVRYRLNNYYWALRITFYLTLKTIILIYHNYYQKILNRLNHQQG